MDNGRERKPWAHTFLPAKGGESMRSKEALQIRILQLCEERNLSLNGLSTLCGVTQSTLNNIISGRNNSANVSTLQKVCDGLGIDLPTFFETTVVRP